VYLTYYKYIKSHFFLGDKEAEALGEGPDAVDIFHASWCASKGHESFMSVSRGLIHPVATL
jgi:hypothetical protein